MKKPKLPEAEGLLFSTVASVFGMSEAQAFFHLTMAAGMKLLGNMMRDSLKNLPKPKAGSDLKEGVPSRLPDIVECQSPRAGKDEHGGVGEG